MSSPGIGSRWRHRKRGGTYVVCFFGRLQTDHPSEQLKDCADMVMYRSEDDWSWSIREVSEFMDGRFEEIAS